MKKLLFSIMILVLLMCGSAFDAEAATYYVKDGGAGAKDGSDYANAFDINGLEAASLSAGDIVNFSGTFTLTEDVDLPSSGSGGTYITYQGDPARACTLNRAGGTFLIDAVDLSYIKIADMTINFSSEGVALINFEDVSYGIVDNVTMTGTMTHYAIRGNCTTIGKLDHCQFINNTIANGDESDLCGQGAIYIIDAVAGNVGGYNLIANNTITGINYNDTWEAYPDGHAIGVMASSYNIIRNNTIKKSKNAISLFAASTDSSTYNVIYSNTITDSKNSGWRSFDGAPISWSGATTATIQNNIIYKNVLDTAWWGYRCGYSDDDSNYIFNNTAYDLKYGTEIRRDADYVHFKNNIFSGTDTYELSIDADTGSNNTYDYNLYGEDLTWRYLGSEYATFALWQTASSQDANSDIGDPLFTDAPNGVFTFSSGPAIDLGTWLTTITSATDTGQTSFVVADAAYFHDGHGVASEVGQSIKTAGGKETVVTDVNYGTNTVTVSPAIDIVQNEGLALVYSGSAPDAGYYEYPGEPEHTNPLVIVNPGTSTYTTGDSVTYNSTITFYEGATVDTITWDYDGQDEAVAALATNVEDPGTVNPTTETGVFSQSLTVTDSQGGSTLVEWTLTIQAADIYDDCTFFETFEVDPQNAYFDYSAGDSNATYSDEAALHADAAYKGSKGLKCVDTNSTRDYAEYSTDVGNIYDGNDIAIGFAFKVTAWDNFTDVVYLYAVGSGIRVRMASTGEIRLSVENGAVLTLDTVDCSLSLNTWYIGRFVVDPATEERTIYIYDTSLVQVCTITTTATPFAALPASTHLWPGNRSEADFGDFYLDNLIISLDHDDPVHEWVQLTKYPKGKWISDITQVSPDGTYGESDTIQCSVNLNPLCGGGTVTDTDAGSDNDMTLSSTLDVGAALVWTADSAYDTALYHHLFTATVVADTTEADLTITSLADGADTADFDLTTIPTNLAASAALVIDTTANTFATLRHSDINGDVIAGAATYTSGYFYLTLVSDSGNLQFKDGPLGSIAPTVALDYGTSLTGTVYSGLDGTTGEVVFRFNIDDVDGARSTTLIMGESALPHGATVICDTSPAENPLSSYNYPDTTAITGGVITITDASIFTICPSGCTGTSYAGVVTAMGSSGLLAGDRVNLKGDIVEDITMSVDGTATAWMILDLENHVIRGDLTVSGDYVRVIGANGIIGTITVTGTPTEIKTNRFKRWWRKLIGRDKWSGDM